MTSHNLSRLDIRKQTGNQLNKGTHGKVSFFKKVSKVYKIRCWLKIQIQNGELFPVDSGKRNMLTVQQAAGTQFHSLLSVHSVLIQGELYPIMRKKKWHTE